MSWDNIEDLKWGDNVDQEEEVAPIVTKTTEKNRKKTDNGVRDTLGTLPLPTCILRDITA